MLEQAQPTDLIRYGLIPEFVGRLPVMGVLSDLDKSALVRILTEPKNALIRQYQRLFEFENVRLRFTDDALETVADLGTATQSGRPRPAHDSRRSDAGDDVSPARSSGNCATL